MQHQKLSYRIPYPTLLHIEDNQIYHGPQNKLVDDKEEEEKEQGENYFQDLNLEYNETLQSSCHQGTQKILQKHQDHFDDCGENVGGMERSQSQINRD